MSWYIEILYHINSVKKIWSFPVQAPHHRPRRLAPPSAVWFPARCQWHWRIRLVERLVERWGRDSVPPPGVKKKKMLSLTFNQQNLKHLGILLTSWKRNFSRLIKKIPFKSLNQQTLVCSQTTQPGNIQPHIFKNIDLQSWCGEQQLTLTPPFAESGSHQLWKSPYPAYWSCWISSFRRLPKTSAPYWSAFAGNP